VFQLFASKISAIYCKKNILKFGVNRDKVKNGDFQPTVIVSQER